MNMKDKVVVITGGNSGIGYATAKELKSLGAKVTITGRRKAALEEAAADLGVDAIVADQSKLEDIEQLVAAVKEQHGNVDFLFINAGIAQTSLIAAATEQHFDDIMDINFKGAYFTLSRFIPLLQAGSSVIFLSSNTASMNHPASSVYSASKAALNVIMRVAALELAPLGIRVNAVSPGPTQTEVLNKAGLDASALAQLQEQIVARVPLAKMGTADDVAKMVAYLFGEHASFITGSEFIMDGGMVL
ncbi:SDR family oxidoreductase [Taibaiella chishuiensis]|uniref:NAD(P)-dependent dehydrogenase (Short-subunit alcohol dehydrogenase family) n=1 Tax=Taibaiella chishuiensis TaxID=1434707 RepID=A0A2P8D7T9_9BACT|nr:SDR family oxidoreductase [Taibaiella chishuiensis]PSK93272.1 NAD(P)-dependent dehydrogenase (short-subunit alcohol dehydrogenase family) [Taibaiella chishuiensis]